MINYSFVLSFRKNTNRIDTYKILEYVILFFGVVFSLFQFFFNRSLWLDESSVVLNILDRSFLQLTQPLDYEQVTPVLFLWTEKIFSLLMPNSDYGLRLFPLLAFFASVFLFWKLIRIFIQDKTIRLFALSLFLFNPAIIFYSNEIKQYILDVFVFNLIVFLTFKTYTNINNKYLLLLISGSVCLFLSHITVIIIFVSAIIVFCQDFYRVKRGSFSYYFLMLSSWLLSSIGFYLLFVKGHPTHDVMIQYWISENAFLPTNPLGYDFYSFLVHKLYTISLNMVLIPRFSYLNAIFIYTMCGIGLYFIVKTKKSMLLLILLVPFLFHLIISSFSLYPFENRLILYLYPSVMMLICFGLIQLRQSLFQTSLIKFNIFIMLLVGGMLINVLTLIPIKKQEMKPVLDFIEKNIEKDDHILVINLAKRSFDYYQKSGYFEAHNSIHKGIQFEGDSSQIVKEILTVKGDCWLLFSHLKQEELYVISQLDSLKCPRKNKFLEYGVSTYLYEIK